MNSLAKAEAMIFSAAYEIYHADLPMQLPESVYQEVMQLYPFTPTDIRDRLELYFIDLAIANCSHDMENSLSYAGYNTLAALLEDELSHQRLCPDIFDLKPKEFFSFDPEISALLPYDIERTE